MQNGLEGRVYGANWFGLSKAGGMWMEGAVVLAAATDGTVEERGLNSVGK